MESFKITKNPRPKIAIYNDIMEDYLIELYEYRNGKYLFTHDYILKTNTWSDHFREWYGDWVYIVWKWTKKDGLIKIHEEKIDDRGKRVLMILDTFQLNEAFMWYHSVLKYKEKHGCEIYIKSSFNKDLKDISSDDIQFVDNYNKDDWYSIYNIGKYDTEHEWNRDKSGMMYDKIITRNGDFCSYRNPIDWHERSINDVANDILGLSEDYLGQPFIF